MPPSPLHSIESEVSASIEALSNDLLVVERQAFADIAFHFRALAAQAEKPNAIYSSLDSALEASTISAYDLFTHAASLAVDASRRDLRSLGTAYEDHTAARIGDLVASDASVGAVDRAVESFKFPMSDLRRAFAGHVRTQTLRAADHADLQLRLFSDRPIAGVGIGVWYKPVGWLQAQARASSMWVVNHVKMTGMAAMNEVL